MTFDEYQAAAARTINPRLTETERLFDAAAGLAEEAGEILGAVRKQAFQSRPMDRERLQLELGDALWCLTITAQSADLGTGNCSRETARATVTGCSGAPW